MYVYTRNNYYTPVKINELKIDGFKSIKNLTIKKPNHFSVFVGANSSGKSNIFEALDFLYLSHVTQPFEIFKSYKNIEDVINNQSLNNPGEHNITLNIDLGVVKPWLQITTEKLADGKWRLNSVGMRDIGAHLQSVTSKNPRRDIVFNDEGFKHLINFSRLFIGNSKLVKRIILDDSKLSLDASNLEIVLKRLLKDENKKDEIIEILQLLIPSFKNLEVQTQELSSTDQLLIFEKHSSKPFPKRLISDGTFNIIALVAAIFQSDEPQFLCIEEPENGLNPKVIRQLINLFREKCEEKGHYIWLNTHSQTLISELTTDEIILVDKVEGITQVRQVKGIELNGLRMDEALLTNTLGGGIPW